MALKRKDVDEDGKDSEKQKKRGKATTFNPTSRLRNFLEPTVWHHFTPLAIETKAVNLGQGFPGWSPPDFVQKALSDASREVGSDFLMNQYARSYGHLRLVNNLAKHYSKILDRKVDPLNEIVISNGCTGALFCVMQGLLQEGDEIVFFEPAFDIYLAQAEMAGAAYRTVPLHVTVNDHKQQVWTMDVKELRQAFTSKTRILLLNSPHNPTGKIFTRAEYMAIRELVLEYPDVVVVSDEVYENVIYDQKEYIHFASLPDMWERTLTLSSAGKKFSCTGWKIGWSVGPNHLTRPIGVAHQWVCFSVHTASQEAVAVSLEEAEKPYKGKKNYYEYLTARYTRKRALLAEALQKAGITPIMPEGSFFIVGDTSQVTVPEKWLTGDHGEPYDWRLARYLTVDIGVAVIPPSSFYSEKNKHLAKYLIRFAFCKPDKVLKEAASRLQKLKTSSSTAMQIDGS